MGKNAGIDTIEFVLHKDKPKDRKSTYVRAFCNIRPHKTESHRTRLTAVGNIIGFPGDFSTPTSDLTTMKLLINSAISDIKARYMCMDMKYFYLSKNMDRAEYIMVQIVMIPH